MPKALREKVIEMLDDPTMTQIDIMDAINAESGKEVLSKSSFNRFVKRLEKTVGRKRGWITPSTNESLSRIAIALERIATSLEKMA